MDDPVVVVVATVALIVLSALFVAAEFALLAARRHRIEERAATSRSARAALKNLDELTVMLAGCQLGITVCALGLGAVTKPAVTYALAPRLADLGAPTWVADAVAFAIGLVVVTFLHLVIGEMAPKSWAIGHPELAATLLGLPMRGFLLVTRPLLASLNGIANACLRLVGVEPQDTLATGRTASDLRQLVEHSAQAGTLDEAAGRQLADVLDLDTLTLADVVRPGRGLTAVPADATVALLRETARSSGHLRLLVRDGGGGAISGVVHVRDSLAADPSAPLAPATVRPVLRLAGTVPVYEALATMRETRNHLVLVDAGEPSEGVLTLADLVRRLLPVPAEVPQTVTAGVAGSGA